MGLVYLFILKKLIMSSYLRNLLKDIPINENNEGKRSVKPLPEWLEKIQSDRPVSFDTTQEYEHKGKSWKSERENIQMRKCFECGIFGHVSLQCTKKKGKITREFLFKETDWICPSCG